jgi:plastocyanin
MHRFRTRTAVALAPFLILGCADAPTAPLSSPLAARATAAASIRSTISVNLHDACDPASFDAAVGPGTCVRNGGMKFGQFVAELTKHQEAGAWHFAPPTFTANVGQTIVARNLGGEVHTFTEVTEFGGGIIPFLNDLSGTPDIADGCKALEDDDFVSPGTTYSAPIALPGTHKFQCCIHPWMRSVVTVK